MKLNGVSWNALVLLFHKFGKITLLLPSKWTNKISRPFPIGPQILYSPNGQKQNLARIC